MRAYQQEDQRWCEHCKTLTMQTFHQVANNYLPEWQCHHCGQVVREETNGVPGA